MRGTQHQHRRFLKNEFGHAFDICDRLCFKDMLKNSITNQENVLRTIKGTEFTTVSIYMTCSTCFFAMKNNKIPQQSTSNGFVYPSKPTSLPPLTSVKQRIFCYNINNQKGFLFKIKARSDRTSVRFYCWYVFYLLDPRFTQQIMLNLVSTKMEQHVKYFKQYVLKNFTSNNFTNI